MAAQVGRDVQRQTGQRLLSQVNLSREILSDMNPFEQKQRHNPNGLYAIGGHSLAKINDLPMEVTPPLFETGCAHQGQGRWHRAQPSRPTLGLRRCLGNRYHGWQPLEEAFACQTIAGRGR